VKQDRRLPDGSRRFYYTVDDVRGAVAKRSRVRTHKILSSGRSGNGCIQDAKSQETRKVFKILQRRRRPFPGRSEGRQSGCGQPRQSLCTMHAHGSAGFSSLSFAGWTPENRILWVRTLGHTLIKQAGMVEVNLFGYEAQSCRKPPGFGVPPSDEWQGFGTTLPIKFILSPIFALWGDAKTASICCVQPLNRAESPLFALFLAAHCRLLRHFSLFYEGMA